MEIYLIFRIIFGNINIFNQHRYFSVHSIITIPLYKVSVSNKYYYKFCKCFDVEYFLKIFLKKL